MAGKAKARGTILRVKTLWGDTVEVLISAKGMQNLAAWKRQRENPCIRLYGAGPEGQTCRQCFYLTPEASPAGHRVYRCDKRRIMTRGPRKRDQVTAPEHYATYPACGKFLATRW